MQIVAGIRGADFIQAQTDVLTTPAAKESFGVGKIKADLSAGACEPKGQTVKIGTEFGGVTVVQNLKPHNKSVAAAPETVRNQSPSRFPYPR